VASGHCSMRGAKILFSLCLAASIVAGTTCSSASECTYDRQNPSLLSARASFAGLKFQCAKDEIVDLLTGVPPPDSATEACAHYLLAEVYYFLLEDQPSRIPAVEQEIVAGYYACPDCACEAATGEPRLQRHRQRVLDSLRQLVLPRDALLPEPSSAEVKRCSRPITAFLLPGTHQYANGHRVKGAVMFTGHVLAWGTSVLLTVAYNKRVSDYNDAWRLYEDAPAAELHDRYMEVSRRYEALDDAEKGRNIAYVATFAFYVLNAVDLLLADPCAQSTGGEGSRTTAQRSLVPDLRLSRNGLVLSWRW
jgi:hypothetical protein